MTTDSTSPKRPPPLWKRRVFIYPGLMIGGYLAWCITLFVMQDGILFPRHVTRQPAGQVPGRRGVEQVWLTADDGSRIEGWFLCGAGRAPGKPGAAVIYAHGNAEIVDDALDAVEPYQLWGISVLIPEFRGYGRSGGAPSQAALTADFTQFHDWLVARPEVDASRIFYHGKSIGGGVVAALAAQRRPAALVLESTFTSVASFALGYGVPEFLVTNPYRTDEFLSTFGGPVLIFHGSRDNLVPVSHGRRLHALAAGSEYHELDAGHNDFPPDWDEYWDLVQSFVARHKLAALHDPRS